MERVLCRQEQQENSLVKKLGTEKRRKETEIYMMIGKKKLDGTGKTENWDKKEKKPRETG